MADRIDGRGAGLGANSKYDKAALAVWTRALIAATVSCLVLHVSRAGLPLATDSLQLISDVDTVLKLAVLANAGVALGWLHRASRNAHAISPGMKYSPNAAVGWFFVPAVNVLYTVAVVYEIWSRSGGPKRSRLLIAWWAMTMPTIYLVYPAWIMSGTTTLGGQLLIAASPITFLALARRVERDQAHAAVAAQFGEPREAPPAAEPQPDQGWVPFARIEPVEDPGSIGTIEARPTVRLTPTPPGKPDVIVLKRPAPAPDVSES